jgi:hypothetical protein
MRTNSQINKKGNNMDKISIISSDARYEALNEILLENGFDSRICDKNSVGSPNILILPIKSALADEDFSKIFEGLDKRTLVFCGESDKVRTYFDGEIINYAKDENFLNENAYITAECALGFSIMEMGKTVKSSKVAIIGYGRIAKHLSKMLVSLGASVTVYARREKVREEAKNLAITALHTDFVSGNLTSCDFDVIYNTVPEKIVSKIVSDKITTKTIVYDLASLPGGFEDINFPKRLLALPGKIMPFASAMAIFDFVKPYL